MRAEQAAFLALLLGQVYFEQEVDRQLEAVPYTLLDDEDFEGLSPHLLD